MHLRPFEIGLITVFMIAAIFGIYKFATYQSDEGDAVVFSEPVVIWGTLDQSTVQDFLQAETRTNKNLSTVRYVRKDPRNFAQEFIEAIADGKSPDLLLIASPSFVTLRTKLQPISYESFPERTFRNTYLDGANVFMRSDGVYGFPVAIDPLVMYWNRDLFSSNAIAEPPKTWETVIGQTVKQLTVRDNAQNISQSALALGEFGNITNAKDIFSMLLLQAGSSLVEERDSSYIVTINKATQNGLPPAESVLPFYTEFATRNKELYTWNRSKQNDRVEFLGGTLALYFGKGSEYTTLLRDNPNANFDLVPVPQGGSATIKRTYADIYALVIPKAAQNRDGAVAVAQLLGSAELSKSLADRFNMASAHRSQVGGETDPIKSVISEAAIMGLSWLDPNPQETAEVFRKMVERRTSGGERVEEVVRDGVYELEKLF